MPTVIRLRNRSRTALADCQPCQAANAAAFRDATPLPASSTVTWAGPIIFEDQLTGDGRYIQANALTWENLPIPLRFAREDTGEHNGAVVVGRITRIERRPGGVIWGEGDFDTGHPDAMEAARQVREHLSNGVSADLDNVSFTVKVAQELLDEEGIPGEPAEQETDADGRVTVLDIDADAEVMDIDDARIRAATLVAVPAFAGARIELADGDGSDDGDGREVVAEPADDDKGVLPNGDPCSCDQDDDDFDPDCQCADTEDTTPNTADDDDQELVAAGGPMIPPSSWFENPGLDVPTALTITDDGRIFGHLALFDSCHLANPQGPGVCTQPPRSASNYAHFRIGAVLTADNREVPVGHITLNTFHAGKQLGAADTLAHYEHTGTTVADVAAGEDDHGIWVAGALRPNLSDDQLRTLRSSPLSGDWRRIGNSLELVAALAVNVPGFPVPRTAGLVASSGAVLSLVASGMVTPTAQQNPTFRSGGDGQTINVHFHGVIDSQSAAREIEQLLAGRAGHDDGTAYLQRIATKDRKRLRAAALRRKVRAGQLARRVQSVR